MSLNKTLLALAVAVALTACSKPADDAAAPAEVPATEIAPAADTMTPATDDAAAAAMVDGSVDPIIAADAATNENVDTVEEALDEAAVDAVEPIEEEKKEGDQ